MMKQKICTPIIILLLLLTACCSQDGPPIAPTMFVKGIPSQQYLFLEGIKHGRSVGIDTLRWQNAYPSDSSQAAFYLWKGLDMSRDTSIFRLSYTNRQGKETADTVIVIYKRSVGQYEAPTLLCGGGGVKVYYDSLKQIYSSAKLPVTITIRQR